MSDNLYVVGFQCSGDTLFSTDIDIYDSLEDACEAASCDLSEPVEAKDANFDEQGRWLVTIDGDVECVIFRK